VVNSPQKSVDQGTNAAAQVADLMLKAAELLAGPGLPDDMADQLARMLRDTHGIRAVHREDVPAQRGDDEPSTVTPQTSGGTPPAVGAPHRWALPPPRRPPDQIVVELAGPEDNEWVSDGQLRLLEAALSVIESAASDITVVPAERLLRHARCIIVQLQPGQWSVCSDAMTRVLGHSLDIASRQSPISLVDGRDRNAALRAYTETRTGRRTEHTLDLRVQAADGSGRVLETTFVRLPSATGAGSVVAYGLDVTEQRTERARQGELVMQLDGAVLVIDEHGIVQLANDAFVRMFGARPSGWSRQRQHDVLPTVAAACSDEQDACARLLSLTTARGRQAARLNLADGRLINLDRVPLAKRGLPLGSLWHFQDITPETGNPAVEEAAEGTHRSALGEQNRVLATFSHELRTPLTAVLSFAELLADPRFGWLDDEQQAATEVIVRNTRRLLALLDDLLLLARLEYGQLPLRTGEVNMAQLVIDAVDDRKLEAAVAAITLTCRAVPGPVLIGDASRLQQVLDNLLRNALKFSEAGDSIQVSTFHQDSSWIVEVSDSGMGIPPDDLAGITSGFQRGSNAVSAEIPGSGLGLAVCREVVELHGGTLAIESTIDVGTTVHIALPAPRGAP
jgi:PAS domain S-box-containing protein